MIHDLDWEFPLARTHTGILQGNATMGTMIWGKGDTLNITIGRADLWDHRGGMPWTDSQNYSDIRRCLEANDELGLRALFVTDTETVAGQPPRPSVIPVGRVDLNLGAGAELKTGVLNVKTGEISIAYEQDGTTRNLTIVLGMETDVMTVTHDAGTGFTVNDRPSWETLDGYLETISFSAPEIQSGDVGGWIQDLPADPGIAVLHRQEGDTLWIATARGDGDAARTLLAKSTTAGADALASSNDTWWSAYWQDVPELTLPNAALDALYAYGMYKFAGFSQPAGIAGTLQGPWIEDYQMPPWSSDYHFNINVQMCYWPAFKANRLSHLMPLFDLIFSWEDKLQANAKAFIGIENGVMLPHAVDDHSTCMGGFWTGCIDHGCTAWVAQMMYDYATYSGDKAFLRDKAYPFMTKAMRVYDAMLEKTDHGYTLPVSVSPEYRGAEMNAWGANASFQLACIHRLIQNLQSAAEQLNETPDTVWKDIADGLPLACLIGDESAPEIALWDGTPLEESHRHHSHLAGICPFDVIDFSEGEWRDIVSRSANRWVGEGMGLWSGWCVPWASMLQSRFDNGEMAELLLTMWESVYTNEGRGTLHDCDFPGLTLMGVQTLSERGHHNEIMQLDAGFGAVVAIQDMMLHTRRGVNHIFAGVPKKWKSCSFDKMLTEGGFLISATRDTRQTQRVEIKAQHQGVIRISNPWDGAVTATSSASGASILDGATLELSLDAGETVVLTIA
jgi:alpha-L-fucosidase 2